VVQAGQKKLLWLARFFDEQKPDKLSGKKTAREQIVGIKVLNFDGFKYKPDMLTRTPLYFCSVESKQVQSFNLMRLLLVFSYIHALTRQHDRV
jgi:hypothetical protein